MNIIVKVPDAIYQHCKNNLKISDKKISALYKQYAESALNQTWHEPIDGFQNWFSSYGEDALVSL